MSQGRCQMCTEKEGDISGITFTAIRYGLNASKDVL